MLTYAIPSYGFFPVDNFCHRDRLRKNTKVSRISHEDVCKLTPLRLNSRFYADANGINRMRINSFILNATPQISHSSKEEEVNEEDDPMHAWMLGKFVDEDRLVYRQIFAIRSYEIGKSETVTMETLVNLLQETAFTHAIRVGGGNKTLSHGFASKEMSLRKLIWVVTRIHVQVHKYSSWGDVVEIDTWIDEDGKYGMRRDWTVRDSTTQQIIAKATSEFVTMNRETRKFSKIPDEVRREVEKFYLPTLAFETGDGSAKRMNTLTDETADTIRCGLAPRWCDVDANQHVNHVKYIGWILESVPVNVMENNDMTSMTLEYRRECRHDDTLESLTSMKMSPYLPDENTVLTTNGGPSEWPMAKIECSHLLRMQEDKALIARATTKWRAKISKTSY